jgi:dTMP kinase
MHPCPGFTLIRCNGLSIIIYLNRKDIIFMAFFITFEGVEGSGKSTQIRLLRERFIQRGQQVLITREPGGCPIADAIRAILLDPDNHGLVPRAELLLYAAARAQHIEEIVRPALATGCMVLCDRFADATTAYQGGGRGLDAALVAELNAVATAGLSPDLTLLLDYPAELGLARARQRIQQGAQQAESRFELEELAFHQRVRSAYLALVAGQARFRVIDARGSVAAVAARIAATVEAFLAERAAS